MKSDKFKEGDKVRIKDGNFEGNIVKIYFDQRVNDNVYVVCKVKLDAPELNPPKSLEEVPAYLESIPSKIKTELKCVTYKLDSEDEMELIS